MRMGVNAAAEDELSADEIVNRWQEKELADLLYRESDEDMAGRENKDEENKKRREQRSERTNQKNELVVGSGRARTGGRNKISGGGRGGEAGWCCCFFYFFCLSVWIKLLHHRKPFQH